MWLISTSIWDQTLYVCTVTKEGTILTLPCVQSLAPFMKNERGASVIYH